MASSLVFDDDPQQGSSGRRLEFDQPALQQEENPSLWEAAKTVTGNLVGVLKQAPAAMVMGAADLPVGAAQLVGNLVGAGDTINPIVSQLEKTYQGTRGEEANTFDPMRLGGGVLSTLPIAAATKVYQGAKGAVPYAMQTAKNLGIGAGTGAAYGVASPVSNVEDGNYADQKVDQIGIGAGVGAALPVASMAVKGLGYGIGALTDVISNRLASIQAGKAIRQALPDEAAAMRAFANAPDNLTAAQIAQQAGVAGPMFQAFGARAKQVMPDDYAALMARQEAARLARLQAETPDLATALAQREGAANVTYGKAYTSDAQRRAVEDAGAEAAALSQSGGISGIGAKAPIPPQVQALTQNPVIAAAAREAGILARASGLDVANPLGSLEGLHLMKIAIDNQFKNRSASTALQNYSDDALRNSKAQLLAAIEGTTNQPGISPLYGVARQQYAALSPEVNQAQVMRELQTTLRKPGDVGERRVQFLAQTEPTGAAALSLLKRADQSPRNVGELSDVLTPAQLAAANKVRGEFSRDILMEKAAKEGGQAATKALQDVNVMARLPSFFDKWITFINKGLASTEERVNEETLKVLAEGMKSGKSLNNLLMILPATERNRVLKGMLKADKVVPSATQVSTDMSLQ